MTETSFLEEHPLQADRQVFRLEKDIAVLWDEIGDRERHGIALVKESGLNIVLTVARGGQRLGEQQPRGAAVIHVIKGRLQVVRGEEKVECSAGDLVALDAEVSREIEILEDSAFLTTVALKPKQ